MQLAYQVIAKQLLASGLDSQVVINEVEEMIATLSLTLQAYQILGNRIECYNLKEQIADQKLLLSFLWNELRP